MALNRFDMFHSWRFSLTPHPSPRSKVADLKTAIEDSWAVPQNVCEPQHCSWQHQVAEVPTTMATCCILLQRVLRSKVALWWTDGERRVSLQSFARERVAATRCRSRARYFSDWTIYGFIGSSNLGCTAKINLEFSFMIHDCSQCGKS